MKGKFNPADWLIYSNLWMAANALAQGVQTRFLLGGRADLSPASGLLFFGTLFLYSLHRIVGVGQLAPFTSSGRHRFISENKTPLFAFAGLGLAGSVYFFFLLSWPIKWALLLPALVAIGYVFPLGASGRRLRDLHFLKIFLLSIVWAFLTVWLPAAELALGSKPATLLMGLERAAFAFALVIPFDIRDLEVDRHMRVKTFPGALGATPAVWLAFGMLALMLVFVFLNSYSPGAKTGLACSATLTFALILFSRRVEHDYYFSGLLDGMLILQFLLVYLFSL